MIIIKTNRISKSIQSNALHRSELTMESNLELPRKNENKAIIRIVNIKIDIFIGFQFDPSYFLTNSKNFYSLKVALIGS